MPLADNFTSLFEFLPIGAYRSRPDGTQMRANPALVRLNGYDSEAELIAAVRNIGEEWYVEPGRRDAFRTLMERDGRVIGFQSEVYRHKSRERIWVNENAHVVRDAAGQLLFYEGTVEEITGRVHAEEAAQTREALLQQILNLMPGVIYRVVHQSDGTRRTTFASQGTRELFGMEAEAMLADPSSWVRLRHPDDRERVRQEVDRAVAARALLSTEIRLLLPDGTLKWAQIFGAPAPDEDGYPVRVGMMFDITARKQAEQALRENGELWKRALESTGDGVWDWDVPSGVEILSPACKALYGYADDELPDRAGALDELTHPDDVAGLRRDREAHLAGHTPSYVNEHRIRCKDGQWKWILSRGIVLTRDARGAPLRFIGTHTDITARKQAEALRFERDRAAAADLAKSQFLSRVSHELRTPLNAILGFSQLLEIDPGAEERQLDWTRHVLASGRHLLALMDDLLDLSSVQTGQLPMSTEAIELHPAVASVRAMLDGAAQAAGVELRVELDGSPPLAVLADARRLRQVVSNLLSNAIKYNRRGGWVQVGARRQGDTVELSVADSGIGLADEQVARLFNPFERVGAQHSGVQGSGLGLALTRELVQAMGGSVGVKSRVGEGSTFYVRLPAA
jgi:PAS domain S-box-containing protein